MLASRIQLASLRATRSSLALHHGTRHWPPSALEAGAQINALQITDPLLIYQAKVARGELEEDQEQVKALVKLRNLSRSLQDYTPPAHLLGILQSSGGIGDHGQQSQRDQRETQNQLVRYLTTQQTLADLDTPKGLLLTGPPGTGKSMVLDIWFDSLPRQNKFRRHYHHLLLTIYRIIWLEAERRRTGLRGGAPPTPMATAEKDLEWGQHAASGPRRTVLPERGTGVLWKRGGEQGLRPDGKGTGWRRVLSGMPFFRPDSLSDGSREMTENERLAQETTTNLAQAAHTTLPLHAASQLFLNYGPILLFDEVQLVDVASAGILKRVLEAYWLLGGVVVGSSNRLPEDLYNNGVQQQQLVEFFEALRNRCPPHEMHGNRDFRRAPGGLEFWNAIGGDQAAEGSGAASAEDASSGQSIGKTTYFLKGQDNAFQQRLSSLISHRTPTPTALKVYNRPVHIPVAYPPTDDEPGVAIFSFHELCDSPLGPADYLSIVSHFEQIVIRDVPQLTLVNKNQARRWITFIDAAYESGSRLLILAASKPDDLFFPEARHEKRQDRPASRGRSASTAEPDDVVDMSARGAPSPFLTPKPGQGYPEEELLARERTGQMSASAQENAQGFGDEQWSDRQELTPEQLIQSETFSEAQQDVEEGFRPNISSYVDLDASSKRSSASSSLAEKRRQENEARRRSREAARAREEVVVGFPDLAIFSGADERFSYARAVSRLHEMSNPIWQRRKQWSPLLESELRLWSGRENDRGRGKVTETVSTTTNEDGSTTTTESVSRTTTSHPSREAHPSMEAMGDFADEASYEASSFPARTSSYNEDDETPPSARQYSLNRSGPIPHNLPSTSKYRSIPSATAPDEAPPKISPVHIWGQADWGPAAGRWGQGPRAKAQEEAEEEGGRAMRQPGETQLQADERLRDRRARLRREREEERLRRPGGQ